MTGWQWSKDVNDNATNSRDVPSRAGISGRDMIPPIKAQYLFPPDLSNTSRGKSTRTSTQISMTRRPWEIVPRGSEELHRSSSTSLRHYDLFDNDPSDLQPPSSVIERHSAFSRRSLRRGSVVPMTLTASRRLAAATKEACRTRSHPPRMDMPNLQRR